MRCATVRDGTCATSPATTLMLAEEHHTRPSIPYLPGSLEIDCWSSVGLMRGAG